MEGRRISGNRERRRWKQGGKEKEVETGREGEYGGNRERKRWEQGGKEIKVGTGREGGGNREERRWKLWELGGNARSGMLRPSCSAAVTSHTF